MTEDKSRVDELIKSCIEEEDGIKTLHVESVVEKAELLVIEKIIDKVKSFKEKIWIDYLYTLFYPDGSHRGSPLHHEEILPTIDKAIDDLIKELEEK